MANETWTPATASPETWTSQVPPPPLPANTVAPVITGVPRRGQTLTATMGTWQYADTLVGQWLRDGAEIPGATSLTLQLGLSDAGTSISFRVTAENISGQTIRSAVAVQVAQLQRFPYAVIL